MKCQSCKKETDYLEAHHIVPKSRGGSNEKSNLINLCVNCHSKAHNVDFNNKRGGLQKEGVLRSLEQFKQGKEWLLDIRNEKLFDKKLMELYEKDDVKYHLIMGLIHHGKMTSYHIMKYIEEGTVTIRTQITL